MKGRKFLLNFLSSLDKAKLAQKKYFAQDKQNCFKAGGRKHFKIMCKDM